MTLTLIIPWWLRPWHTVKALRRWNKSQAETIIRQSDAAAVYRSRINELQEQAWQLSQPPLPAVAPLTGVPELAMVGQDRGNGQGKRLFASRDLAGTGLSMTDESDPPPRWKVSAVMGNMLVIDKPTYGEAMEHMAMIWRNWERDARVHDHAGRPWVLDMEDRWWMKVGGLWWPSYPETLLGGSDTARGGTTAVHFSDGTSVTARGGAGGSSSLANEIEIANSRLEDAIKARTDEIVKFIEKLGN